MIDRAQVQKLSDIPIESVASRLGLRVVRHRSLCPFHDDHHASLTFDRGRNRFRCFVCGEYGRTIDLVMKVRHVDFRDACMWLADDSLCLETPKGESFEEKEERRKDAFDATRYARFFEHPWLSPEAKQFLYDERMLDARVVRWCQLTSWRDKGGTNWLTIPYYDTDGRLVGIQQRNLDYSRQKAEGQEKGCRFKFPTGSRCSVYNMPVLKMLASGEPLFITEGCSDCWAMLSAGHKAIAIPSATLLHEEDVERLKALGSRLGTTFHMYPDQDEPGERLFLQLRERLPNLARHQLPTDCKDFSDYYLQQKR